MKIKTQIRTRWVASLALILTLTQAHSQKYILDAGHSSIQSKVIRFGVVPVVGRFNDVSGTIVYDQNNLSNTKADLVIKSASYSANNQAGEAAIKSAAFLDTSSYPDILFNLTSLEKKGDDYLAKGSLELHGTTKEVELPVLIVGPEMDLPTRKQSVGITGNFTIDRTEFGVGKQMQLPTGRVIVSNEVQIEFVILGIAE